MDLFSSNNDIEISTGRRRSRQAAHADYEGFVEKFKSKLTTDDCFTPPAVYESVSEWLRRNAPVGGRPIVRPFWPGGDYERFDYPPDCVVVDNPPFSIISGIARFLPKAGNFVLSVRPASDTVQYAGYRLDLSADRGSCNIRKRCGGEHFVHQQFVRKPPYMGPVRIEGCDPCSR